MDITSNIKYVYVTIPKEYVCVYHRILAMLADYGEEMLKDCKASCTDKNSGVIECYNMFNAAVAASKLSNTFNNSSTGELEKEKDKYEKLADTIIKYVKAKINQIYQGKNNSTDFVFPVDETGELKAFVSCGETVKFEVDDNTAELVIHKYGDGINQHFELGPEDYGEPSLPVGSNLTVTFEPAYEIIGTDVQPCIDNLEVTATYREEDPSIDSSYLVTKIIPLNDANLELNYYFDDIPVESFNDIHHVTEDTHKFTVVAKYSNLIDVVNKTKTYEAN